MKKLQNRNTKSIFKKFSKEENEAWKILSEMRLKSLKDHAHPMHKIGWDLLCFSTTEIPDFKLLNKKLGILTGWQVASTSVQYENDDAWISSLSKKVMRITDFIREKENLDYTPLPDIFHDAFGHLPFLAIPQYARIAEKFGLAYVKAKTKEERLKIANNWWYGIEFSFMKVGGELKALGTGLISSEGELENALSDKVEKLPYDADLIGRIDRSAHTFHDKLFVLNSLDQLEEVVDNLLK